MAAADPLRHLPQAERLKVDQLHGLTGCELVDCATALEASGGDAEAAAEALLLATHAGAKLYATLGYRQLGTLLLYTPQK